MKIKNTIGMIIGLAFATPVFAVNYNGILYAQGFAEGQIYAHQEITQIESSYPKYTSSQLDQTAIEQLSADANGFVISEEGLAPNYYVQGVTDALFGIIAELEDGQLILVPSGGGGTKQSIPSPRVRVKAERIER